MKKFDYKEYITDNWLLKEATSLKRAMKQATSSDLKGFATKDATLKRQDRLKKGNWKDSLGKFVETHGDDINAALKVGQLRNYVETKMKPALGPEAQQYLDGLLQSCRFDSKLLQALYNVSLKGSGLGLHEESEGPRNPKYGEDYDRWDLSDNSLKSFLERDVKEFAELCREIDSDDNTGPAGSSWSVISTVLEFYAPELPERFWDEAVDRVHEFLVDETDFEWTTVQDPMKAGESLSEWLEAVFDDPGWWNEEEDEDYK